MKKEDIEMNEVASFVKVEGEAHGVSLRKKRIFDIMVFLLTPVALLGLMILVLNYNTKIWYYLKPKPIILTLVLLELIHVLFTAVTRK